MIDLRHKTAVRGDPVAGQQKSELCSACHGAHGIAVVSIFPNLPGQQVGQILLRDASKQPLVRRPDGLFTPLSLPPGSDFPTGPEPIVITSSSLEGSNVNAVYGMTRLIDQARSFEAQIRAIKQAKDLDESSATLMKAA